MIGKHLALGTVQFGLDYGIANTRGIVADDELIEILTLARKSEITTLDTAMIYGSSEQRLGKIGVSDWQVVTKLPAVPDDVADLKSWIRSKINESLALLQIGKLHGLLLHAPMQLLGSSGNEIYRELDACKKEGLIGKIGFSVYSPNELDLLYKEFSPDIIQAPLNIIDRRLVHSGWLKRLKDLEVEVHVRSAFLQGLLLMSPDTRPDKFRKWHALWEKWDSFLVQNGITSVEACLNYIFTVQGIDKIIIGVDNVAHLQEILKIRSNISITFPKTLSCSDTQLLNPSLWTSLG